MAQTTSVLHTQKPPNTNRPPTLLEVLASYLAYARESVIDAIKELDILMDLEVLKGWHPEFALRPNELMRISRDWAGHDYDNWSSHPLNELLRLSAVALFSLEDLRLIFRDVPHDE